MATSRRNSSQGGYTLGLFRRAQDAQRHRQLTFTFRAANSLDLRRALAMLVRIGVVGHVSSYRFPDSLGRSPREITCTLRYWDGEPLIGVAVGPMRQVSYHDLLRRIELGGGYGMLLWSDGRLKTVKECLAARAGGLTLAIISG
jgi:hypothetical protein